MISYSKFDYSEQLDALYMNALTTLKMKATHETFYRYRISNMIKDFITYQNFLDDLETDN